MAARRTCLRVRTSSRGIRGSSSATTARTTILTGEDDTIAAPSQSDALFEAMPAAASRIVYEAQTDTYGNPSSQDLVADHSAPAQDLGFLELAAASKFLSNADLVWRWELRRT